MRETGILLAGVSTNIILRDEAWSLMGRPSTLTVCIEEQFNPTPHSWQAEAGVEAAFGKNPIERLLVTTKAPDVNRAVVGVFDRLTTNAVVVILCNGMGVYDELMSNRRLPGVSYLLASTTHGVFSPERFKCVHSGFGETWVGRPPGSTLSLEDTQATVAALQQTGLSVKLEDKIEDVLWHKLAVNAAINGLTAIMGCRNGAILDSDHGRSLVKHLCAEAGLVMKASGIPVPEDLLSRVLNVVRLNANNFSSMHQDMAFGRATEVDYLNGFVVKKGNLLGVHTPTNRVVYDLVKMKELMLKK